MIAAEGIGKIANDAFFFGPENHAMYAMVHLPIADKKKAVIFCQPFADEVQRSYRPLYNFANTLSARGYLVFRFEYRGCGDSQIEHFHTNVTTRLKDINTAIKYVKKRYNIEKIALLGLRFGATLAYFASRNNDLVDSLVLWEPIIEGRRYFYDCLRLNIATQMIVYRRVPYSRERLVKRLKEKGEPVYIDGYAISKSFFEEGCNINLIEHTDSIKPATLFISISSKDKSLNKATEQFLEKKACGISNFSHIVINESSFWMDKRNYIPFSTSLYEETLNWLKVNF